MGSFRPTQRVAERVQRTLVAEVAGSADQMIGEQNRTLVDGITVDLG